MFTLIVKAITMPTLMRKTGVSKLHDFEQFEFYEGTILMMMKVLTRLDELVASGSLSEREH